MRHPLKSRGRDIPLRGEFKAVQSVKEKPPRTAAKLIKVELYKAHAARVLWRWAKEKARRNSELKEEFTDFLLNENWGQLGAIFQKPPKNGLKIAKNGQKCPFFWWR